MPQAVSYLKSLFSIDRYPEPRMIWCFYRYPYRIGLSFTVLTGLTILLCITAFLLLGCAIWAVIEAVSLLVILLFYAVCIALATSGFHLDSKWPGLITLCIGCYIWYLYAPRVHTFAYDIFEYGNGTFLTFYAPFYTTMVFLEENWESVLGGIVAPAMFVFALAALLIAAIYILQTTEWVVLNIYSIGFRCTYTDCNRSTEPAVYCCPKCNKQHEKNLIPNKYGIFYHRCTVCGYRLPTMMLLGRNRNLDRNCRECGRPVNKVVGIDKHIGFVGPRKSGKTCLLVQSTDLLTSELGATIPEEIHKREFEHSVAQIKSGQVPPQTQKMNSFSAFQLKIPHKPYPYHVYLYDIAGENYQDFDDVEKFGFFANLNSILFLLDPFSSKSFRSKVSPPPGLEIADQEPLPILKNTIQAIEKLRTDSLSLKNIHFNVLLVKSDLMYLKLPESTSEEVSKQLIRKFIIETMEEEAFIHQVEGAFGEKVNYLMVSSLGRNPQHNNQKPFIGKNLNRCLSEVLKNIGIKN